METLRDEFLCPMVDRIPGALSATCIGQQIMLDIMDALFQFTQALFSPKGKARLYYVDLTQKRLEDLSSNVAAMRARSKRYEKIVEENETKPAIILTAKQYGEFLKKMKPIYEETEAMRLSNEEYAERQLDKRSGSPDA